MTMKTKLCSHEAMDRCAMMLTILEREVYNHPGLNRDEKKKIKKAMKNSCKMIAEKIHVVIGLYEMQTKNIKIKKLKNAILNELCEEYQIKKEAVLRVMRCH